MSSYFIYHSGPKFIWLTWEINEWDFVIHNFIDGSYIVGMYVVSLVYFASHKNHVWLLQLLLLYIHSVWYFDDGISFSSVCRRERRELFYWMRHGLAFTMVSFQWYTYTISAIPFIPQITNCIYIHSLHSIDVLFSTINCKWNLIWILYEIPEVIHIF